MVTQPSPAQPSLITHTINIAAVVVVVVVVGCNITTAAAECAGTLFGDARSN